MATIKEIAKRAGVSPSTVSRVLRGKGRVSSETKERILRIAKELGYSPNVSARALVTGRTSTVGFLIHPRQSLDSGSFYGEILAGVEKETNAFGFHLIFSTQVSEDLPPMVKERRIDGLIIAGCDIPKELIFAVREQGIPLVLVDYHLDKVDSVFTDNIGGAYEAVTHLIRLGHKKIGFICEWFDDLSFAERFKGYKLALEDNGLPFDEALTAEGVPRKEGSGYIAMKKLLEKNLPSAVFAANDSAAAYAIQALKEKGLKVPQDIAVVGFDDGPIAIHTEPPLTTMRVFREKMGILAARRLLELIEDPEQPSIEVKVSTRLIIRDSCGAHLKQQVKGGDVSG